MTVPGPTWVVATLALAAVALGGCGQPADRTAQSPADLVRQGWSQFTMGEYDLAARRFDAARQAAHDDAGTLAQATYGLAVTAWLRQPNPDLAHATDLFDALATGPDPEYAAWGALCLVRMRHLVPGNAVPDYPALYQRLKTPLALSVRSPQAVLIDLERLDLEPVELLGQLGELAHQFLALFW